MLKLARYVLKGGYTCKKANDFLTDYVEGRLDEKTARLFEEHIELCPNCDEYLDQYRETVKMVKEIPETEVPSELTEKTREFLASALKKRENGSENSANGEENAD
jgi:anti-sigma factor RsiW